MAAQVYNPEPGTNPDPNAAANTIALAQLTAGIAGAIVGGGQAGANIASAAGANAVENNWLSQKSPRGPLFNSQQQQYDAAVAACNGGSGSAEACTVARQLANVSAANENALHSACSFGAGQTTGCITQTQLAQANGNTVVTDRFGNTFTTNAYPNGYPSIQGNETPFSSIALQNPRFPDGYSFSAPLFVFGSATVTIDRHGQIYFGPGVGFPDFGAVVTWAPTQSGLVPTAVETASFFNGVSYSATVGPGMTYSPGHSPAFSIGTPSIGLSNTLRVK